MALDDDEMLELIMDTVNVFMKTQSTDDDDFDQALSAVVDEAAYHAEAYARISQLVNSTTTLEADRSR